MRRPPALASGPRRVDPPVGAAVVDPPVVAAMGEAAPLPADRVAELCARITVQGPRDDLPVLSPLHGEEIARVPACGAEDVVAAVARAREVQPSWAARTVEKRAKVLRRVARLVFQRQREVLDLIQLEAGKVRIQAFDELGDVSLVAAYYARTAARHLRPQRREGAFPALTSTTEYRHPKGVVGIIAPWNYPLSMALSDALPALVAGNACVVKPARRTPLTALWGAELLADAGLPDGLFQVITGRGPELGDALIDAVDAITFTGSTATGRGVAARAGQRLVAASLELGGKNAMVVLEDADLARAVDGAVLGCFASAGQLCVSIERIYLQASIADEFLDRLLARVRSLELSAEVGWQGDMGSLISPEQLASVERHVADAVERGAGVLVGGERRPEIGALVYAPTVLTGVTDEMAVAEEETFGPVVAVATFADDDEAVAAVNRGRYGLNASVWTRDRRRGQRLARRLRAGTVNLNDAFGAAWASNDAPMGGMADSGLGRRHGRDGIWRYTEPQTVAVQRLLPVTSNLPGLTPERSARLMGAALQAVGRCPRLPSWPRRFGRPPRA